MKNKKFRLQKKAVSLMLSYVILISIVIALSVGVYAWIRTMAVSPEIVDCKEGTSVILDTYKCSSGNLELNIKNNGRFNVDGIILSVGNNPQQTPTAYLISQLTGGGLEGHYEFSSPLKPGETQNADFSNMDSNRNEIDIIEIISIQPYIIENNKRINCQQAVITQLITDCQIKL